MRARQAASRGCDGRRRGGDGGVGGGLFLAGGAGEERALLVAPGARRAICRMRVKIRSATGNLKQDGETGIKMPEIEQISIGRGAASDNNPP